MTIGSAAANHSPDWLIRPFEVSKLAPAWLGLGLTIAFPLFVALVYVISTATLGSAEVPFGPVRFAATVVVNGALFGLILAGHAQLHLGAVSDLRELRPMLPGDDAEFARLSHDVPNVSTRVRWLATIIGAIGGSAVATLDPTLQPLYGNVSGSDPRYILFVGHNVLFGAVAARLFSAEIHMTRAYARLGELVEVDLLDLSKLRVFARKGLRSVVVWVLISSTFSLFWVLDSAGQANFFLPVGILGLVAMALVAPTLGVHRNIAAAKTAELMLVAEAIRTERANTLAPRSTDAPPEDARLGNLIDYQSFVKSIREWPFDLRIISRSLLLIVLGAGSWLGGAVVERLLDLYLS